MTASLRGQLLVASPSLRDPNFARTVVYLLEHQPAGALGVVINRPTEAEVDDVLPTWAPHAAPPRVLFRGGPVAELGALCLGPSPEGGVAIVDLEDEPDEGTPDGVRIFLGHAGWGEGQLDAELEVGGWIPLPAEPVDAFSPDPGGLWERVLRRAGGHYALLASAPPDLSMN